MRQSFLTPLLALSLTATLAAGCFAPEIVVPPPEPPPSVPPPVPVPPPPPVDPGPGTPPPPTDGRENTGVLWLVRVDPATANLAAHYAQRVAALNAALTRQGFTVRATVVASLYSQRVLWASGNPRSVDGLDKMLVSAANAPASPPTVCSTGVLEALGANLPGLEPELLVESDTRPFASPRATLLVGVLDHGPRPRAYTDPGCLTADGTAGDTFGEAPADVRWVNRSLQGGWRLARVRTRFVLVTSSEDESYDTMRARCAAVPGLPTGAQDIVAPSAVPFYGPWATDLGARQAGLATRVDLCTALGSDFKSAADAIATAWADDLKAAP